MKKWRLSAVMFLFLAFCSCKNMGSYLEIVKDARISNAYLNVLNNWTRKETIYSQFETRAQITATYKSADFNRAYREEYASIYNLTESERKHREEMVATFTGEDREILFYAAMADKAANDFDKASSSWTLFLSDNQGNQIKPLEIRKIEKITPVMEAFFPYINKYHGICYNLKFPPADAAAVKAAGKPLRLVVNGVLGKTELSWP